MVSVSVRTEISNRQSERETGREARKQSGQGEKFLDVTSLTERPPGLLRQAGGLFWDPTPKHSYTRCAVVGGGRLQM